MTKPTRTKRKVTKPVVKRAAIPSTKRITELGLDAVIRTIAEHKSTIKDLTDEVSTLQAQVIEAMEEKGQTTRRVKSPTATILATIVHGSRLVIDEASLKTKLGAQMWNKVTTRSLDRGKLDAFIASGEVDAMTVAAASSELPNRPFLKITKS